MPCSWAATQVTKARERRKIQVAQAKNTRRGRRVPTDDEKHDNQTLSRSSYTVASHRDAHSRRSTHLFVFVSKYIYISTEAKNTNRQPTNACHHRRCPSRRSFSSVFNPFYLFISKSKSQDVATRPAPMEGELSSDSGSERCRGCGDRNNGTTATMLIRRSGGRLEHGNAWAFRASFDRAGNGSSSLNVDVMLTLCLRCFF